MTRLVLTNADLTVEKIPFTLTLNIDQLKAILGTLQQTGYIHDWRLESVQIPDDEDLSAQLWEGYLESMGAPA
jgi:hypothetical protein